MNKGRRLILGGIAGAAVIAAALIIMGGEEEELINASSDQPPTAGGSPSPSPGILARKRTVFGKLRRAGANSYARARRTINRLLE